MKSVCFKAALEYEKLGFSVIPLVPREKFPPKGVTWKDRQTKRATPKEIKMWWNNHPTAHVGMITGAISGVDSIDLDGSLAADILEAETGIELPESISYKTGRKSGGEQRLFKYHGGGLKTRAGYAGDGNGNGIDLKTDGGLTVLPPSIHKSGKRYTWNIDPREMGLDDLEDFPPEVLKFMAEKCKDGPPRGERWKGKS